MITIDDLIQQGEEFVSQIAENPSAGWRSRYYLENDKASEYKVWKATAKRFIGAHYSGDKAIEEFEQTSNYHLSPDNHQKLLAILKAIRAIPQPNAVPMNNGRKGDIIVNNSNTVSQTQNTTVWCTAFIESIKHELTGRQLQEIKEILEQHKDTPETAKPKIIEKLMSFGSNVAAGILGNLMTTPNIYAGILNGLG